MGNKDTGIVTIHGKEYQTVARRIEDFRATHPAWTIQSELLARDENTVVVKAEILDENGRVISTGFAEESRSASKINKTSAVENAETSAVGRALAFFGMGGTEIASADEVAGAIAQQNGQPERITTTFDTLRHLMEQTSTEESAVVAWATENQYETLDETPVYLFPRIEKALKAKAQQMEKTNAAG